MRGIRNGITGMDVGPHLLDHSYYETPAEGSRAAIYARLAADIRKALKEKKAEKRAIELEQGAENAYRRNYEFFLKCLGELPEEYAGHRIVVNGLDTDGSIFRSADGKVKDRRGGAFRAGHMKITPERIEEAPDMLHYQKSMYIAFIKGTTLKRRMERLAPGVEAETDELIIEFDTSFGLKLTAHNVQRTLSGFLGYKRVTDDGTVEFLDHIWKAVKRTICYKRSAVKWKRPDITKRHDREFDERMNS